MIPNNPFGLEEEDEDDFEDVPIGMFCELMAVKQACDNMGRCIVFDGNTMEFVMCVHFTFDDPTEFMNGPITGEGNN